MMPNMVPPQQQFPIDEMRSPINGAEILEFCESELFPENLQNSEAGSSSNCCYEEHTSYQRPPSMTMDHHSTMQYNNTTTVDLDDGRNRNLGMVLEDETVDDISASIDFSRLSPTSFSHHDQQQMQMQMQMQYNCSNEEGFNQIQLLGDAAAEGSLYAPQQMAAAGADIRLRSSSVGDPMYLCNSSSAPFTFDSSWMLFTGGGGSGGGLLLGTELESQGDNGAFFLPDSFARVFNCSNADLQTLSSSESQHMMNGSPLASEISSLDDPTFKVGKLSAEERKRKIHRYLKKRNERNFSKKIKYACRKTLADSRPRVRGRFAKNDELGELARNTGNNQYDDVDEDVNEMFPNSIPDHHHHKAVKEKDGMDPSELFAHMSEVNSFKCSNYPIQSWI